MLDVEVGTRVYSELNERCLVYLYSSTLFSYCQVAPNYLSRLVNLW